MPAITLQYCLKQRINGGNEMESYNSYAFSKARRRRRNYAKSVAVGVSVGASQASMTLPLFSICLTANLDHECVLCLWVGVIAGVGGVLYSLWFQVASEHGVGVAAGPGCRGLLWCDGCCVLL
jgi:hypothetical protein